MQPMTKGLLVAISLVTFGNGIAFARAIIDVQRAEAILTRNCPACDKADTHAAVTGIVVNGKDYHDALALACAGALHLTPMTQLAINQQDKFLLYCFGKTKKP